MNDQNNTPASPEQHGLSVTVGSAFATIVGFDASDRTLTIQMPHSLLDKGYAIGASIVIGESFCRKCESESLAHEHTAQLEEDRRAESAERMASVQSLLTPNHVISDPHENIRK